MANVEFKYAPMFQTGKDTTEYRLLTKEGVTVSEFEGKKIVKVSKEALTLLAQECFHDVEFKLRREHNLQVAKILTDPEASENDKYVALQFLRNAETAVKGILPFCRTLVPLSSTQRRVSRFGQASRTKRLSHSVSTTPIPRTTSATRRTLLSTCTMRLTQSATSQLRSISRLARALSTSSLWLLRAVALPTRHTSTQ